MANLASCKPQVESFRSICPSQARQARRAATASNPVKHDQSRFSDRRHVLWSSVLGAAALCTSHEVSAIPLAPLGKRADKVGGDKLQMPSVDQVKVSANTYAEAYYLLCSYIHTLLSLVFAAGRSKQGLSWGPVLCDWRPNSRGVCRWLQANAMPLFASASACAFLVLLH